ISPAPAADSAAQVLAQWNAVYDAHNEVAPRRSYYWPWLCRETKMSWLCAPRRSYYWPDEVFSTWIEFGGNTRDLAHLEKKRTRLRTCTKIHQEVLFSELGDGVASIKRRHCDLSGDSV
ncbi:hypothetical protein Tco_1299483, partial [Tanacetum coccineum]